MEFDLSTGQRLDEPTTNQEPEPEYGDDMRDGALLHAVQEYAETVEIDVDLEPVTFEVSHQMKRAAGKCGYKKRRGNREYYIRIARGAYDEWGWSEETRAVIRHELVHLWEFQTHGKAGHGRVFSKKARELDAPRHCQKFSEHNYELVCSGCGEVRATRYQKSKVIKHPERYVNKCCRGTPYESRSV